MPLNSIIEGRAQQCTATSKRTRQRCQCLAAYDCRTCYVHGARKKEGIRHGAEHGRYRHGEYTQDSKAAVKRIAELGKLVVAINHLSTLQRAGQIGVVSGHLAVLYSRLGYVPTLRGGKMNLGSR